MSRPEKIISIIMLFLSGALFAQETKLKIFTDCQTGCYLTYLKQNLQGVEFVRDRHDADVYILITSEANGSGGETYYVDFEGQGKFKNVKEQLIFNTNPDMQAEEIRTKLLKVIRLGLAKFWLHAGADDIFDIQFHQTAQTVKPPEDKWNNWVFRMSVSGFGNGDSNFSSVNYNTGFSARQVKKEHKFKFSLHYSHGKQKYVFGDYIIRSKKESFSTHISEILSINEHWSYGFFGGAYRSSYSNYRFAGYFNAGVEYDFFPYSQSSKHLLALQFKIGPQRNIYFEKTIFGQTMETLWQSQLSLVTDIVRKWGNINLSLNYDQYLGKPELRSFSFYSGIQLRLYKGLNFRVSGSYAITHDKINIAAGGASLEEILLRQKELLSSYNFFASVGLSYSFGSIYNTIVNPRFGGGGSRVYYFY